MNSHDYNLWLATDSQLRQVVTRPAGSTATLYVLQKLHAAEPRSWSWCRGCLVGWLTDWLVDWLTEWVSLSQWLIGWLIGGKLVGCSLWLSLLLLVAFLWLFGHCHLKRTTTISGDCRPPVLLSISQVIFRINCLMTKFIKHHAPLTPSIRTNNPWPFDGIHCKPVATVGDWFTIRNYVDHWHWLLLTEPPLTSDWSTMSCWLITTMSQ